MSVLEGSFWIYFQYDVAEEIHLDELRRLAGAEPPQRGPSFKHPVPDYVRFERPPVVTAIRDVSLDGVEHLSGRMKYFDYGVVSVELELPFSLGWDELVLLASRWISAPEIERRILYLVRDEIAHLSGAFHEPCDNWLSEDYYVIQLGPVREPDGTPTTGQRLLECCGPKIAQIVRGEAQPLSASEQREALSSPMSYYPCDLLVMGWVAAFVYDTVDGAAPTMQLLEYANSQLLEFRYYDDLLTRVLSRAYKSFDKRRDLIERWKQQREAHTLNTLRLDVTELAERIDTSIKFLSDMFYARVYRLAADKVGVTDYRRLVDEKLRTADDLYRTMVEDFRQTRAFILELMVVIILVIELAFYFKPK